MSHSARDRLPDRDFAVINRSATTEREKRKYPIYDRPHARNALARVSRFGSTREKHLVCVKVHRRFPDIHETHCEIHRLRA